MRRGGWKRPSAFLLVATSLAWISDALGQQTYQATVGTGLQTSYECQLGTTCPAGRVGPAPYNECGTLTHPNLGPLSLLSTLPLLKQGDHWIPAQASAIQKPDAEDIIYTVSSLDSSGIVTTTQESSYIAPGVTENNHTKERLDLNTGLYTWDRSIPTTVVVGSYCTETFNQTQDRTATLPINLYPYTYKLTSSISFTNPALAGTISPLPFSSSVDAVAAATAPPARGVAADGSSAIAIVVKSNSSVSPMLTLSGVGLTSNAAPGGSVGSLTLYRSDYLTNPQPGSSTSLSGLTPVDTSTCSATTDQAGTSSCTFLALLWAPPSMPYSSSDLASLSAEPVVLTVTGTQPNTGGTTLTFSNTAELVPPPLVLVHGVWSSASQAWPSFSDWLARNYQSALLIPADYGPTSSLSFKDVANQDVLAETIANALVLSAHTGIAAQKVDVFAHSMGGLLTRYMEENGLPAAISSYLPSSPIHKLITVGTPHVGTPLAVTLWKAKDWYVLPRANPIIPLLCGTASTCTLSQVLASQGRVVGSAVNDLQAGLGAPTSESYQSIAGDAPTTSGLGTEFNLLLSAFVPGANSVDTILQTTDNDALVPGAMSQLKYSSDSTTISGIVHTSAGFFGDVGETESTQVFNQALYWLMEGSGTIPSSTVQRSERSVSRPMDILAGSGTNPVLDLTGYTQVPLANTSFAPASGSSLPIGSVTNITVTSSKTISEVLLFQNVTDPTDTWLTYSTQTPFSIAYTPTRLGSANFTAFVVFSDKTFATTALHYVLNVSGTTFGLRFVNAPSANLVIGLPTRVTVQAGFSSGFVDVTGSSKLTTGSGGSNVFSVGTDGTITPISPGIDVLSASYGGSNISAEVSVGQCAYALAPANQIVSFNGGAGTVQVNGSSGCAWTAQSTDSWLTLTTGTGSGSGSVAFTALPNTSGTSRTAYVTLAGQDVAIVQPSTACNYTVSPSTLNVPASGAVGTLSVTTSCPITSSSNALWATATTLSQSSVAYSVASNNGGQSRSAVLVIGTQQVQVAQLASSAPTVTLNPASLSFGNHVIGSKSSASSITITNAGTTALTLSSITVAGTDASEFALTNNCASSIAAGATCTISIAFAPTYAGSAAANVSIADNASGSPQLIPLAGTGTVAPGFTVAGSSVTIGSPGASTGNTATVTVTPTGGFTGSVVLAASITSSPSGAQDLPTLSFGSTSPVIINGANAATATLTISTTAAAARIQHLPRRPGDPSLPTEAAIAGVLLACLRPKRRMSILLPITLLMMSITLIGCTGKNSSGSGAPPKDPGTTIGTYTVTVTATSGATSAQTTLSVLLQ